MVLRFGLTCLLFLVVACGAGTDSNAPVDDAARSGGATTVFDQSSAAFSTPAPNLSADRLALHVAGDIAFEAIFVTAPAPVNPGLGPLFVSTSCRSCHVNDGRGLPPLPGEVPRGLLFRLSVPGSDSTGAPLGAGVLGTQLQVRATAGFTPEGGVVTSRHDSAGTYGDGTPFVLEVPTYQLVDLDPSAPATLLVSPRIALPVFGLGLLEAIPEAVVVAGADPADRNHDGISGRPNRVWNPLTGSQGLGRFGHKANTATVALQVAGAYHEDMGITTSVFPWETCAGLPSCPTGPPELADTVLQLTALYVRTLGVPARRNLGTATVRRGETLFQAARCGSCHTPTFTTGVLAGVPEVSGQRIHPYTDLLLHDMGPGLADGRPDFLATGSEWRTMPLWGIGLTPVVSGQTRFLHDGRARSLAEAILWHDGEARGAREFFQQLPSADRAALITFLESL